MRKECRSHVPVGGGIFVVALVSVGIGDEVTFGDDIARIRVGQSLFSSKREMFLFFLAPIAMVYSTRGGRAPVDFDLMEYSLLKTAGMHQT